MSYKNISLSCGLVKYFYISNMLGSPLSCLFLNIYYPTAGFIMKLNHTWVDSVYRSILSHFTISLPDHKPNDGTPCSLLIAIFRCNFSNCFSISQIWHYCLLVCQIESHNIIKTIKNKYGNGAIILLKCSLFKICEIAINQSRSMLY